ncbi:thioredoxin, mitochondrial [Anabrus simplex]|uniref:thioredoxin, mitochondrial n=1 Tax=Anabrus simplex TaxID=316456 RepID=UPI0034DDCA42
MFNSLAVVNVLSSPARRLACMTLALPKHINVPAGIQCLDISSPVHRSLSCSIPLTKSFTVKNNNEFMQRVMQSDIPVIVNFHAEWCDPCKILSPKLMELVDPLEHIDLAIVDVETNAELVHTFEVKAVPAVLAVKNGLVVDKFIGLVDADMIENLVNKLSGNDVISSSATGGKDSGGTPIDPQGGPAKDK